MLRTPTSAHTVGHTLWPRLLMVAFGSLLSLLSLPAFAQAPLYTTDVCEPLFSVDPLSSLPEALSESIDDDRPWSEDLGVSLEPSSDDASPLHTLPHTIHLQHRRVSLALITIATLLPVEVLAEDDQLGAGMTCEDGQSCDPEADAASVRDAFLASFSEEPGAITAPAAPTPGPMCVPGEPGCDVDLTLTNNISSPDSSHYSLTMGSPEDPYALPGVSWRLLRLLPSIPLEPAGLLPRLLADRLDRPPRPVG